MRTVYVIGIGAGDPEHLTLQAITAMNRVDVFFTVDKGPATKADLSRLRGELLARHVTRAYRVVQRARPAPGPDGVLRPATRRRWPTGRTGGRPATS